MSGGSWEHVMGVMVDENGKPINSESIETDLMDKRYYDTYKYHTNTYQYSNRILGDATGEMGPFIQEQYTGTTNGAQTQTKPNSAWYHDRAFFVLNSSSWFGRGGYYNYGFESGVFAFSHNTGDASLDLAFRITLAF